MGLLAHCIAKPIYVVVKKSTVFVYCRAQQGVWMACAQKTQTPNWLSEKGLIWKATFGVRVAGGMTFFWLVGGEVTGWYLWNLIHQPSGFSQSGVYVLVLSMRSPSSTWVGYLSSCRTTQRYVSDCYVFNIFLEEELCFIAELLFLDCFSFISAFPHFSN